MRKPMKRRAREIEENCTQYLHDPICGLLAPFSLIVPPIPDASAQKRRYYLSLGARDDDGYASGVVCERSWE